MICKCFVLVGSGFIGQVYVVSFVCYEGSVLMMVVDVVLECVQVLVVCYGVWVVIVSEVIYSDVIDVVLIVSLILLYVELLEVVVRVGKVVYCEKLIDFILVCVCEVVEWVFFLNVLVIVGFNWCFDSSYQQFCCQLE